MRLAVVLLTLFSISATFVEYPCRSRPAARDEHPSRGNEDIEIRHKTVSHIIGRVTDANYEPIKNAVVEVYERKRADYDTTVIETSKRTRLAACVADDEGRFCFSGLSSGNYILKFGTHDEPGFQAVYMRIALDRRWWSKWFWSSADLNIVLPVAT